MAGNKDSAFSYLGRLATKSRYSNYRHLTTDPDLTVLHADNRWDNLCKLVKQNKDKEEEGLNKPLVAILDTIYLDDQQGRMQLDDVQKKYGYNATEVKALWKQISFKDSIDLIKVARILDQYGWLGADVVGDQGNTTLFLVVQHADLKVQEKYLPMMRNAVKAKRASPSALALLEDRVALREGKKQIYGSQVHGSPDGKNWISPLEDPDNVDKRRAEVGLGPLADYVSQWNIVWDPAQYKKDLPEIEEKEGRK